MENETPFDLESAIRKWRDSLLQSSRLRAEELEELELHLRDSVIALQERGLSEDEAWIIAQKRLGQRETLKEERKAILDLRNKRVINDEVLRRIQRDLDLAETRLKRAQS